jgi:hypothetical protein
MLPSVAFYLLRYTHVVMMPFILQQSTAVFYACLTPPIPVTSVFRAILKVDLVDFRRHHRCPFVDASPTYLNPTTGTYSKLSYISAEAQYSHLPITLIRLHAYYLA